MTKEGKGNKKTDNQVTTGKKTVTSANVATVTKMKAKVPTKPKVQNDLDENLVEEAVKGLLAYEAKKSIQENSSSLLDHYAKPILVQIQLKKAIQSSVLRPIRIKIPHTLFDPTINGQEHTICLFCRTDDKVEIENELEKNPIIGLNKIITLSDLKKYYKNFQDRRKLFKEFTHFLCDNRLFSHVINLLGKVFSARNNYPIPIEMSNIQKLSAAVNKSIHQSTYLSLSGTLLSLRFGLTSMSSRNIIENILNGLPIVFEKLQFGFGSVNSIHLKSSDSPALPIHYSHQNEISEFLKMKVQSSKKNEKGKTKNDKTKGTKGNKKQATAAIATEEIDAPLPSPATDAAAAVTAGKKKNKKTKSKEEETATAAPASVAAAIETIKPFSSPEAATTPAPPAQEKKQKKGKQTKQTQETVVPETVEPPPAPASPVVAASEKTLNKKKKKVASEPEVAVETPQPIVGKKRTKGSATAAPSVAVSEEEVEERVETSAREKSKKSKLRK